MSRRHAAQVTTIWLARAKWAVGQQLIGHAHYDLQKVNEQKTRSSFAQWKWDLFPKTGPAKPVWNTVVWHANIILPRNFTDNYPIRLGLTCCINVRVKCGRSTNITSMHCCGYHFILVYPKLILRLFPFGHKTKEHGLPPPHPPPLPSPTTILLYYNLKVAIFWRKLFRPSVCFSTFNRIAYYSNCLVKF